MSKIPYPFSVCKNCCTPGGGGGETVVINGAYKYKRVLLSDVLRSMPLEKNTVTYAYGAFTDVDGLHIELQSMEVEETAEEKVLILDLTSVESTPTIVFEGAGTDRGLLWMNGEPPVVEKGKIYMFSFTTVFDDADSVVCLLAVGGEFA